jgi:hypothetical protein
VGTACGTNGEYGNVYRLFGREARGKQTTWKAKIEVGG